MPSSTERIESSSPPSTSYVRDVQEGVVRRAAAALGLDYIMVRRFFERWPGEARE